MEKGKREVQQLSFLYGALIGALITPALMAVMFIGERFAGMPFVPFDFFNWIARVLPGGLITFGIDSIVTVLIALGFGDNLDTAAKTAEQLMALTIFFGLGVFVCALFVYLMNRVKISKVNSIPGAVFGLIFGFPFIAIVRRVNVTSTAPDIMQIVWLGLLFVGFGMVVNWAYNTLTFQSEAELKDGAEGIDRRQFMVRLGGATAMLTVVGAGLGALLRSTTGEPSTASPQTTASIGDVPTDGKGNPLPNANADVQPVPGTRPEYTPVRDHYRIDILSGGLPSIPEDYTLPITGLVANEVAWSLDEIKQMPSQDAFITMSCISNRLGGSLISTTKWTGVPLQHILDEIQPDDSAVALKITGADNFDEYVSLDLIREDDRIMLAYHFDDEPLPLRNGFPLRIHIPDRYGMKQPKWIQSIEVIDEMERGYWVRRGWSADAIVNATSVIDTVATDEIYTDANDTMRVPVGGIAWAGDRGIARVEVRVDGGEWQEAELRDPLSERAWVIWRYDWAFEEGSHTFEVQCYEKPTDTANNPILQPTTRQGTRPDGATGIHSAMEFLRVPQSEDEGDTANAG